MSKENRYFQFPLCLLMETYKDRQKGLNLISSYGIIHFARSLKWDITSVSRQVVYDYYRNIDELPRNVRITIEEAEENENFTFNDDYKCFDVNGNFDDDLNVPEVLKILEDNPDIKEEAIEHYQIHQAADFLNIKIGSLKNTLKQYSEAKGIQASFEQRFGADAMASIKPSLLFSFRDDPKQNIDILRAYIGIISMIGYRNFISTNKPAILSRMIGCKSKAAFQELSGRKEVRATIDKYSKRYNIDNLLLNLAERKFIMYLSKKATSVIYVSRYMEPQELADMVRNSRNRYNLKSKIKDATASL